MTWTKRTPDIDGRRPRHHRHVRAFPGCSGHGGALEQRPGRRGAIGSSPAESVAPRAPSKQVEDPDRARLRPVFGARVLRCHVRRTAPRKWADELAPGLPGDLLGGVGARGLSPRDYSGAISVYGGATLNTYLLMNLARNPRVLGFGGANCGQHRQRHGLPGHARLVQAEPAARVTPCRRVLDVAGRRARPAEPAQWECNIALAGGASVSVEASSTATAMWKAAWRPRTDAAVRSTQARGAVRQRRGAWWCSSCGPPCAIWRHRAPSSRARPSTTRWFAQGGLHGAGRGGTGQVVAEALAAASVDADTIGYVEEPTAPRHRWGDPIEVEGALRALPRHHPFGRFCALTAR